MNADILAQAYLAIRDERDKLKAQYETQDSALAADMDVVAGEMMKACNAVNGNSINTTHGLIMRKLNERYYSTDWENFSKFVIQQNAVGLLERRIHQNNFRQFLSEHKEEGLPPGVNVQREYSIVVRKPSSRSSNE